jgi:glycosyltransferase involved in cell wall biosynthesis
MRVLFLHEVNYLSKPVFEVHEFPEYLARLGHEVGFVHFPEGSKNGNGRQRNWKAEISGRVAEEVNITLYTPWTPSGNLFGRLVTAGVFFFQFKKVLNDFKPDVVVSFSVPTSGWQALSLCKKRGIPYLFRALDVSTEIRKSPFNKLVRLAENYIYRNSDWVSANNPAMLEYVLSRGASSESSSVIYPTLALNKFMVSQEVGKEVRASLGIPESSRVILFMGSFFYFSGLPEVIDSFGSVGPKDAYLVLVGMGEQDKQLREQVEDLELEDKVVFTGRVGFSELRRYFSAADVAINPFQPSAVSHTALPNKVLQYMAAGLPVVSTRLKGLEATFGEANKGLVFTEKPKEVIGAAIELIEGDVELSKLGSENKQIVSQIFSDQQTINSFEKLLLKISGEIR